MTEVEATAFVMDAEGRACVRFHQRRDGTILTSDCPVGWKRKLWLRIAAVAGLAILGAIGWIAFGSDGTSTSSCPRWFLSILELLGLTDRTVTGLS